MTTYKRGDRVMLAAFEDQPEEAAVVLERQRRGMYTVAGRGRSLGPRRRHP